MPPTQPELGTENQSLYQVHSRREILNLLQGIKNQRQLITMVINGGAEVVVTSILDIDDKANLVYIDLAPNVLINQRILESDDIEFESTLDKVRISFFASSVNECTQDGRQALCIAVPPVMIRLQRREYFRVNTPPKPPVYCKIPLASGVYTTTVVDISGGGIAILDEKRVLESQIGEEYQNCKIDLGENGLLNVTLQIRNTQDFSLANGKTNRRFGCEFVKMAPGMLTMVQRYIMQLERERNAKMHGMV
jgi:flagellar brake protein